MPDYNSYQKSITRELNAVKNRVKNFIDNKHHGEDGRYKEVLLKDILRRSLPEIIKTGTGFVVGENKETTSQIDIIIYDSRYPMLFQKEDFVVAPKESVLGIIEVKTNFKRNGATEIKKAIEKTKENAEIIMRLNSVTGGRVYGRYSGQQRLFNGIFAYGCDNEVLTSDTVRNALQENNGFLNHIAFGANHFMKYFAVSQTADFKFLPQSEMYAYYRFYDMPEQAYGYFISNLIDRIHIKLNNTPINSTTFKDFLYPIENSKESQAMTELDIKCEYPD